MGAEVGGLEEVFAHAPWSGVGVIMDGGGGAGGGACSEEEGRFDRERGVIE